MKRTITMIAVGLLAGVVMLGAAVILISSGLSLGGSASAETDLRAETITPSPSGEYTAVVYTESGGGAAGWCYRYVTVFKSGAEGPAAELKPEGSVFSSTCRNQLDLRWMDDRHLGVSYGGDALRQKGFSDDSAVLISYGLLAAAE